MARKTRTSKNTEEKQADATEVAEDPKHESPEADTPQAESEATSEVADAPDTPIDDAKTEQTTDADESEADTSGGAEGATPDDDTPVDAGKDVATEVAGVVPAQAETTAPMAPPPAAPAAPAAPRETSGPGALSLVFGGLVAGAIGFLVATFAGPEGWPNPAPDDTGVSQEDLAALSGRIDGLAAEVEGIIIPTVEPAEPVDLGPLEANIDTLRSSLSDAEARLDDLAVAIDALGPRIIALEERPIVTIPDGAAAMEAQLQAFRADLDAVTKAAREEIEEARARASQIELEAAEAAAAAARQAAIAEIAAALESGAPFSGPATRLDDMPEGLQSVADTGVRTLSVLQDEFPDRARAALQATQTVPEDASAGDRMVAFLRRQTNARSLSPREGDDPDAILSRAEAALSAGDLETALGEIETLPEDAQAAMGPWIDEARARHAAVASLGQLN